MLIKALLYMMLPISATIVFNPQKCPSNTRMGAPSDLFSNTDLEQHVRLEWESNIISGFNNDSDPDIEVSLYSQASPAVNTAYLQLGYANDTRPFRTTALALARKDPLTFFGIEFESQKARFSESNVVLEPYSNFHCERMEFNLGDFQIVFKNAFLTTLTRSRFCDTYVHPCEPNESCNFVDGMVTCLPTEDGSLVTVNNISRADYWKHYRCNIPLPETQSNDVPATATLQIAENITDRRTIVNINDRVNYIYTGDMELTIAFGESSEPQRVEFMDDWDRDICYNFAGRSTKIPTWSEQGRQIGLSMKGIITDDRLSVTVVVNDEVLEADWFYNPFGLFHCDYVELIGDTVSMKMTDYLVGRYVDEETICSQPIFNPCRYYDPDSRCKFSSLDGSYQCVTNVPTTGPSEFGFGKCESRNYRDYSSEPPPISPQPSTTWTNWPPTPAPITRSTPRPSPRPTPRIRDRSIPSEDGDSDNTTLTIPIFLFVGIFLAVNCYYCLKQWSEPNETTAGAPDAAPEAPVENSSPPSRPSPSAQVAAAVYGDVDKPYDC